MALSGQDVIDFLNVTLTDADCPRCGTNSWSVGGPDVLAFHRIVGGGLFDSPSVATNNVEVVFLGCNNCGHLEFHLQEPILLWKAARKKAS